MSTVDRILEALADQLPAHVDRQRWTPAPHSSVERVELERHDVIRGEEPFLIWVIAQAHLADGGSRGIQLLVGARHAEHLPDFLQGKQRQSMALCRDESGRDLVAYDALVDPELAMDVLHLVAPDVQAEVTRPIVVEHANTSVVFDEELILKVFRRIGSGPNPDAEIPRVLAERGFEHVLPPIAELRRDGVDLAVLRPFLVGAMSAWQIASTSLRDMLADRVRPEEAGADLAPDAQRVGMVVGELHVALADAFGTEPGDPAAWSEAMILRIDEDGAIPPSVRPDGPDRERVLDRFRRLADLADPGTGVRIHGNLHLDQLIKSDSGWFVLDFEGTQTRKIVSATGRSSPLRDVAGLTRSLNQATAALLSQWDGVDDELRELAADWMARSREAFMGGYLSVEGVEDLLPRSDSDRAELLAAFELDLAIHPVGHRVISPGTDQQAVTQLLDELDRS